MGDTNRKDRITNYMVLFDLCLAIASAIIEEISIDWITRETISISSVLSCSTTFCLEAELLTSSFSLISLTGDRVMEVSPIPGVSRSSSWLAGTLEHLAPQGPGCPLVGWLHLEQVLPFGVTVATETVSEGFEGVTGAVAVGETTEAGAEKEEDSAEAAASAWAAWWRAARRRFFSFCTGPRWRGVN